LATRHRVAVAGIVCPLIRGCVVRGQEHYSIGWRAQGPKSDASQIEALAEFLGADADHLSCAKPIAIFGIGFGQSAAGKSLVAREIIDMPNPLRSVW